MLELFFNLLKKVHSIMLSGGQNWSVKWSKVIEFININMRAAKSRKSVLNAVYQHCISVLYAMSKLVWIVRTWFCEVNSLYIQLISQSWTTISPMLFCRRLLLLIQWVFFFQSSISALSAASIFNNILKFSSIALWF